jgi:hypothetical protein
VGVGGVWNCGPCTLVHSRVVSVHNVPNRPVQTGALQSWQSSLRLTPHCCTPSKETALYSHQTAAHQPRRWHCTHNTRAITRRHHAYRRCCHTLFAHCRQHRNRHTVQRCHLKKRAAVYALTTLRPNPQIHPLQIRHMPLLTSTSYLRVSFPFHTKETREPATPWFNQTCENSAAMYYCSSKPDRPYTHDQ